MSDSTPEVSIGLYSPEVQSVRDQNNAFYEQIIAPQLETQLLEAEVNSASTPGTSTEVRTLQLKTPTGNELLVRRSEVTFESSVPAKKGDVFATNTIITQETKDGPITLLISDIPKLMPKNPNEKDIREMSISHVVDGKIIKPKDSDQLIRDLLQTCNGAKVKTVEQK